MPEITHPTLNPRPTNKRSWQALTVAALVLAGAFALPQAADAATTSHTCGDWFATKCSMTVVTKKSLSLSATSSGPSARVSYRAQANSGRVLCSGQLNFNRSAVRCSLGSYNGPVKITVDKIWGSVATIRASY